MTASQSNLWLPTFGVPGAKQCHSGGNLAGLPM